MNINLQISIPRNIFTHITPRLLRVASVSLALILGSTLMSQAQTPTPTPCGTDIQAVRQSEETLGANYQPSHYDPYDHTMMKL